MQALLSSMVFLEVLQVSLQLTYATASNTATYAVKDFEYKGESQWLIGDSAALHSATSGGTQGTPRYSLNSSGHLILNTTA